MKTNLFSIREKNREKSTFQAGEIAEWLRILEEFLSKPSSVLSIYTAVCKHI